MGGFESPASKKAVFRDKFDACHVVMAATKTTWLASKKEEYLHRHIAYIVVHGKKKKKMERKTKKTPSLSLWINHLLLEVRQNKVFLPTIPIEKFLVRQVCEVCVVESNQDDCSHRLCPPCVVQ